MNRRWLAFLLAFICATQIASATQYKPLYRNPTTGKINELGSGDTIYGAPSGPAGAALTQSSITADPNPAVVNTYYDMTATSAQNFTLPTAVGNSGKQVWLHLTSSTTNAVTLLTTSSQTLGSYTAHASGTLVESTPGSTWIFTSDNANWDISAVSVGF